MVASSVNDKNKLENNRAAGAAAWALCCLWHMWISCLTSHIVEWRQSWPVDGLHPLSCLHGHMCAFIDSPLAHPSNKSPPTRRQFSPPSAVWLWWWVFCSMADTSRLLAVSQPTWRHQGVARGTRRQDLRLENAFFVPPFDLKGPNAKHVAT